MMPVWVWIVAAAAVAFVLWFAWGRGWWRSVRYSWQRAAHVLELTETEVIPGAEYGSMIYDEDPHARRQAGLRARYGDIYAGPHELTWREQTRVELAPEALEFGGGQGYELHERLFDDPGPGDSSSASPGPDQLGGGVGTADGMHRDPVTSPEPSRLADTGEIRDAHLLAEVAAELRAQDDDARAYCSALERDRQTYMHQLREVFA